MSPPHSGAQAVAWFRGVQMASLGVKLGVLFLALALLASYHGGL